MKLIEAMKKLRVIEKRMAENIKSITQYASMPTNERPYFDTEQGQRAKVKELVQSNSDLMKEYLWLKRCVEKSNLETTMEMGGKQYTLSELLVIKRKMGAVMLNTFNALNDGAAQLRLAQFRSQASDGKTPTIARYYQEDDKINGKKEYQDLLDNIESRLEVHNAITELIEVPKR
jgi:hypothetical protein